MKAGLFSRLFMLSWFTTIMIIFLGTSLQSFAAEYTYATEYVKVNTADNVLVVTQDTSKYDDIWGAVGVTDAESKLDEFENMGIVASFYNPETKLTVNFITNRTNETVELFAFRDLSDDEILNFVNTVMTGTLEDNLSIEVSVERELNAYPFFRMLIDATNTDTPCREVVYGTIINGKMLQFDAYFEGNSQINESFVREIVRGVSFTAEYTPEEYEEVVKAARGKLVWIAVGLVGAIALVVALAVFLGKSKERKAKKISEAMTDFRERTKRGEIDKNGEPKYTVQTTYDEELFNKFGIYCAWFKPDGIFIGGMIVFVLLTIYMFSNYQYVFSLILASLIVVMLYLHYSAEEKAKDALAKRYDVKHTPTPVFRFYEEYFTVSGLSTSGEYIYKQITRVADYKGSIYLFLGSAQAFIINSEDVKECSIRDIKALIKAKN